MCYVSSDDCTFIWGKTYTGVAVEKWLFDPQGTLMLGPTQGPPRPVTLGEILAYGGNAENRNRLLVAADVQARNVSFSVLVDGAKILVSRYKKSPAFVESDMVLI